MTTLARLPVCTEVFDTTRDAIVRRRRSRRAWADSRLSLRELRSQLRPTTGPWSASRPGSTRSTAAARIAVHAARLREAARLRRRRRADGSDLRHGASRRRPLAARRHALRLRVRFALLPERPHAPGGAGARDRRVAAAAAGRPRALGRQRPPARDRMEPGGASGRRRRSRRIDQDRDSLGLHRSATTARYRVSTMPATIGDLLRRSRATRRTSISSTPRGCTTTSTTTWRAR